MREHFMFKKLRNRKKFIRSVLEVFLSYFRSLEKLQDRQLIDEEMAKTLLYLDNKRLEKLEVQVWLDFPEFRSWFYNTWQTFEYVRETMWEEPNEIQKNIREKEMKNLNEMMNLIVD